MESSGSWRKIISIPMILVYILVYIFRYPIMIYILTLYTQYFDFGKAFTERLIGEFYFAESRRDDAKANKHFSISLEIYQDQLKKVNDPDEQARIEALIGSQYECGKGVKPSLIKAREYYESASKKGNVDASTALSSLNQYIEETHGAATMGKQCVAPLSDQQ